MKIRNALFVVACMALCLIPSLLMLFFPTTQTTENRAMTEAPQLVTEEGELNQDFFNTFESYFCEHMALRNQMVYADSVVQTKVFGVSNVGGVTYGTDGWLYYTSTIPDYSGVSVLSKRELYNLAHNISVVQQYLEECDISFLMTIPPNKNTLYKDNMPYYASGIVNTDHNALLLEPLLTSLNVNYLNLFSLFENQEDILYLKQDSHWNTKGAGMAFDAIMDELEREHREYSKADEVRISDAGGDLNRMLYSFYGKEELSVSYDLPQNYHYEKDSMTVESGWVATENETGTGTILMFRDSFANALIPFLSNEFRSAYYSKGQPHALERYLETTEPDCVVFEKVERNIDDYLVAPPIISAVETKKPTTISIAEPTAFVEIDVCENDVNYYQISGTLKTGTVDETTEIVVAVNGVYYLAYQTNEDDYLLYLKAAELPEKEVAVLVYAVEGDVYRCVGNEVLERP